MSATLTIAPSPWQQFFDASGNPVAYGQLYARVAGTTTLQNTYSDAAGTTANTNPVILDSAGRAAIYLLPASYRFTLYDSVANGGALLRDQDNIAATPGTSAYPDVPAIAGEAVTAGQGVYLSDGSGSKTSGRWYLWSSANAYSSTEPTVGMVVADIASGSTGTVRLTGQITGLTALVAGTDYYVGTAGALSSTGSRFVGRADSTSTFILAGNPPQPLVDPGVCEGRLTLTTGVPVTTADVTAATTVYFAPYKGNTVSLYSGTVWARRAFTQLSIAVPATTSSLYDVFVYDNAGTATLELSSAWSSDTAIFGSGTYATTRPTQDGVYVKSTNGTTIDTTRRYLGTFRTTAVSGQTEDSVAKAYLYNHYHAQPRPLQVTDATPNWNWQTATWRQANGATANQVEIVSGVAERPITVRVNAAAYNGTSAYLNLGIGEDSTSAPTAPASASILTVGSTALILQLATELRKVPAVGRHYYAWLEASQAVGTTVWQGTNTTVGGNAQTSALTGEWVH